MGAGLTLSTVVPTSMIGIIALFFIPNSEDPFTIFPELAINHVPFAIGAAMLMGVLGASMSTANGGLLAISSVMSRNIVQRDILKRILKRPGLDDKRLLMTTRIFTIPMMVAAFVLAYLIPQPGVYLILAFDIVFAGAWAPFDSGTILEEGQYACCTCFTYCWFRIKTGFVFHNTCGLCWSRYYDSTCRILCALHSSSPCNPEKISRKTWYHSLLPPEEDIIRGEDLKVTSILVEQNFNR